MAKILEFIKEQAKKAGINTEDDKFKAFFASDALKEIEVPDDLTTPIGSALISITDAKNHGDLKNHYYKMSLDGLDKSIGTLISEYGLTEDVKNAIDLEKNSYLKPGLLAKAIKEAEAKKATAGNTDKAKIQAEIDSLHAQLRTANEKASAAETKFAQDKKKLDVRYKLDDMLGEYKTIHDGLSKKNKSLIIHTLLEQGTQEKGAKWEIDENDNLVLVKSDGTALYGDNNTQIQPKGFIEKLLSDNKFLVVADKNGNQQQNNSNNGQSGQSGAPQGGQGQGKGATPGFKNAIAKAMEDANNSTSIFGGGN